MSTRRGSSSKAVQPLRSEELTRTFAGEVVSEIHAGPGHVDVRFVSGRALVIGERPADEPKGAPARAARGPRGPGQPTPRQREYLQFLARYMARYGVAPAESDIARHFMVSAPSVNQMIRTLEERGFIRRSVNLFTGQTASRSIRVLIEL
jgi:hypothetical protein